MTRQRRTACVRRVRREPGERQSTALRDLARARVTLGIGPDLAADNVAAREALGGELKPSELAEELTAALEMPFLHRDYMD
jgi:hypothetical protein